MSPVVVVVVVVLWRGEAEAREERRDMARRRLSRTRMFGNIFGGTAMEYWFTGSLVHWFIQLEARTKLERSSRVREERYWVQVQGHLGIPGTYSKDGAHQRLFQD